MPNGKKPFCVKGGEIIGNVPTIEELAKYIKDYIINEGYSIAWASDNVKGATRQAVYDMHQTVVGQLEYKGLWDANGGSYPSNPELGWYYVVSVDGDVGGVFYRIGDWIIWNGTSWDKLAGRSDVDPIGAQINYFGIGIKGDIQTRDYEISVANGDDFDMRGWFVANGKVGTPSCIGRFNRGAVISGDVGGSDDAVVVEHIHGASQEVHTHNVKGTKLYVGIEATAERLMLNSASGEVPDYVSSETPAVTVESEGVTGIDKNIPGYINSIPIIKMS